jgi:hypothetical protein
MMLCTCATAYFIVDDIKSVSSTSIYDVHRYPVKLAEFGSPNVALVLHAPVRTTFGKQTSTLAIAISGARAG